MLHSLRHTMLIRLAESEVDTFAIMRIAEQSSIVVSHRWHPSTPEAVNKLSSDCKMSGKAQFH